MIAPQWAIRWDMTQPPILEDQKLPPSAASGDRTISNIEAVFTCNREKPVQRPAVNRHVWAAPYRGRWTFPTLLCVLTTTQNHKWEEPATDLCHIVLPGDFLHQLILNMLTRPSLCAESTECSSSSRPFSAKVNCFFSIWRLLSQFFHLWDSFMPSFPSSSAPTPPPPPPAPLSQINLLHLFEQLWFQPPLLPGFNSDRWEEKGGKRRSNREKGAVSPYILWGIIERSIVGAFTLWNVFKKRTWIRLQENMFWQEAIQYFYFKRFKFSRESGFVL